eukprot:g43873.t1
MRIFDYADLHGDSKILVQLAELITIAVGITSRPLRSPITIVGDRFSASVARRNKHRVLMFPAVAKAKGISSSCRTLLIYMEEMNFLCKGAFQWMCDSLCHPAPWLLRQHAVEQSFWPYKKNVTGTGDMEHANYLERSTAVRPRPSFAKPGT